MSEQNGFIPPHSIEAEQAVMGAIFVDPGCLPEVTLILKKPEMFWRASHQHIYRAIQSLSAEGHEIDWVSVGEQVRKDGALDECGGADALHSYLSEISHSVPSAYAAERYATIVRDRALMREIILRAGDIRSMALDETKSPGDVIEKLEQDVFDIAAQRFHGQTHTVQALIQQVMEQQARMREWRLSHDGHALPGLSSGYSDLDAFTTGWKPGELIVIGARPGQGKTSLMLNLAENIALDTHNRRDDGKGGVLLFSLEMTATELVQRVICSNAGVDLKKVKLGLYNKDEEGELKAATQRLAQAAIFVDDSFTLNLSEIRSKARRMKERHDIECIFVDYLQLIKDNDRLDRHLQIGNISRGLKALARELEIPVITAAQLNRGVEQRSSREKRPMLSDLRESGSIEQDADQVLMIHKKESEEGMIDTNEMAEIDLIIAKNRNGPAGDVEMLFRKRYTRFELRQSVPTNWASVPQG
ncbi:MAG: replicative DNA helicase [Planctomycetes bacterium]|nr:replicative DNA helicase [Planctomycetota bacterium]MCA8936016.1 replicative DNA helicase [Planctomycetota bacterium]MCA8945936.1 replicative DNA helicase [Planctomycetota bacterium]